MTTDKMKFLMGYNTKQNYLVGGIDLLVHRINETSNK